MNCVNISFFRNNSPLIQKRVEKQTFFMSYLLLPLWPARPTPTWKFLLPLTCAPNFNLSAAGAGHALSSCADKPDRISALPVNESNARSRVLSPGILASCVVFSASTSARCVYSFVGTMTREDGDVTGARQRDRSSSVVAAEHLQWVGGKSEWVVRRKRVCVCGSSRCVRHSTLFVY